MDERQNLYELQLSVFEAFKSQDSEMMDIIFEINGKKLYADKTRLSAISPTFKSMLSDRWTSSKNESTKIDGCIFEDFKEFLTFIYSGKCNLTNENIFDMTDIAEFYDVSVFKNVCDEFLSKMEITLENVNQLLEHANTYSLIRLKSALKNFILNNFTSLILSKEILKFEKSTIKEYFLSLNINNILKQQLLFKAVYDWAENQSLIKEKQTWKKVFNLNDAIKAEMQEFLPYFDFKNMTFKFLTNFVVKKGFLFSYDDLSEILSCKNSEVSVTVTNNVGQLLYGKCAANDQIVEAIKFLKNYSSRNIGLDSIYWRLENKQLKIPSSSCLIEKRNEVEWYLCQISNNSFGVKHRENLSMNDYLIAEMFEYDNFFITHNCTIEIV